MNFEPRRRGSVKRREVSFCIALKDVSYLVMNVLIYNLLHLLCVCCNAVRFDEVAILYLNIFRGVRDRSRSRSRDRRRAKNRSRSPVRGRQRERVRYKNSEKSRRRRTRRYYTMINFSGVH